MSSHVHKNHALKNAARRLSKQSGISYQAAVAQLRAERADGGRIPASDRTRNLSEALFDRYGNRPATRASRLINLGDYLIEVAGMRLVTPGDRARLHKLEGDEEIQAYCPFCPSPEAVPTGDGTGKLYLRRSTRYTSQLMWRCYGPCQSQGQLIDAVQRVTGAQDALAAAQALNGFGGVELFEDRPQGAEERLSGHLASLREEQQAAVRRDQRLSEYNTEDRSAYSIDYVWQLLLDRAVTDHALGYGDTISITVDGSTVAVTDEGRGVPSSEDLGWYGLEETLRAGRYADTSADGKPVTPVNLSLAESTLLSRGAAAYGLALANALSERMCVSTVRNGHRHNILCQAGGDLVEHERIEDPTSGENCKNSIRVTLDTSMFEDPRITKNDMLHRLTLLSFMFPGLRLQMDFEGDKREYFQAGGLADALVPWSHRHEPPLPAKPLQLHEETTNWSLDLALTWFPGWGSTYPKTPNRSFINTLEAGAFLQSQITSRLTREIQNYLRERDLNHSRVTEEVVAENLSIQLSVLSVLGGAHNVDRFHQDSRGADDEMLDAAGAWFAQWLRDDANRSDVQSLIVEGFAGIGVEGFAGIGVEPPAPTEYDAAYDELQALHIAYDDDPTNERWQAFKRRMAELGRAGGDSERAADDYDERMQEAADLRGSW